MAGQPSLGGAPSQPPRRGGQKQAHLTGFGLEPRRKESPCSDGDGYGAGPSHLVWFASSNRINLNPRLPQFPPCIQRRTLYIGLLRKLLYLPLLRVISSFWGGNHINSQMSKQLGVGCTCAMWSPNFGRRQTGDAA